MALATDVSDFEGHLCSERARGVLAFGEVLIGRAQIAGDYRERIKKPPNTSTGVWGKPLFPGATNVGSPATPS